MPPSYANVPNNTNPIWYKDPGLRMNVLHGSGLCLVIAANGYSGGLLTTFQAMPSWLHYFNAPKGTRLGLYAAAYFLPSIVTAFIGDFVADRYGRRTCVALGMTIVLLGSVLNTIAANVAMWVAGRAVIGAGVGIVKVAAPVLIQEIAHPRLRPTLGSLYQAFAYFGSLTAAWMGFAGLYLPGNWGWRFPSLLQIIGPAMVLAITWLAPESPRWLVKQGRNDEALAVLAKYHANGDQADALVQLEFVEIVNALGSQPGSEVKQAGFRDFLRTSGNRRRLVVLVSLALSLNWMGNGIISYYLAPILVSVGITAPVQITLINASLAIWNLLWAGAAALNVDKIGRRPLFLISILGMLVSYGVIMGLSAGFATTKKSSLGVAVVPLLFIYFAFYDIAFTPLPIAYTVEILPFSIRTKGLALFTSVATLGNSFNQFVNPVALAALAWKYYAVYIAILIGYFILAYFLFLETKGLTVEEVSVVFDRGRREVAESAAGLQAAVVHEKEKDEQLESKRSSLDK